jgi:hypothetical protein
MSTEFTEEELESNLEVWMINNRDEAVGMFGEDIVYAITDEVDYE